ncbi:hypothetical protein A9Q83_06405 [Alphaproteobacteria bacterium 46_93_T64]|nr:hypothetical protein A9Q83_06405 [Alphaproteobacteria bacterium 46_93_T64]
MHKLLSLALVVTIVSLLLSARISSATPIYIGLDADMSSSASLSGISIQRGALIAIDEINKSGGVLGRPLELLTKDHRGNPARGKDNIEDLAERSDLVAIIGGLHTPVAMAELETIHNEEVIYLGAWAAGTPVVKNNFDPNFVFRVSVRDEFASEFLLNQAKMNGYVSPCLLLENTGWGRSNKKGFDQAAQKLSMKIEDTQWFNWGVKDLSSELIRFNNSRCDVVMMVANAKEGGVAVNSMLNLPTDNRLPIISHWGITGGDFPSIVGRDFAELNLSFLQTYSFFKPSSEKMAIKFLDGYFQKFATSKQLKDIVAPVGSAHAYDLVHLLTHAIRRAGVTDRLVVREALENMERYEGLVRTYDPAFTKQRHDALDISDFSLARFNAAGVIIPVEGAK